MCAKPQALALRWVSNGVTHLGLCVFRLIIYIFQRATKKNTCLSTYFTNGNSIDVGQ